MPPTYSIVSSTTASKKIRFVWDADGEPQYGLSPFPNTYKNAVTAATQLFRKQITSVYPDLNIILKCGDKNRKGEFIWSSINPADWNLLVGDGDEVAVIECSAMTEKRFIEGMVFLTVGVKAARGTIKWHGPVTGIDQQLMGRPKSSQIAIEMVREVSKYNQNDNNMTCQWPHEFNVISKTTMEFFEFHDDKRTTWSAFPRAAYENAEIWRRVVPLPGRCLGVILTER